MGGREGDQIFHIFLASPPSRDRPAEPVHVRLPPPPALPTIPPFINSLGPHLLIFWSAVGRHSVKTSERCPAPKGQHKLQVTANSRRPPPPTSTQACSTSIGTQECDDGKLPTQTELEAKKFRRILQVRNKISYAK